jgi:hypothetical protein
MISSPGCAAWRAAHLSAKHASTRFVPAKNREAAGVLSEIYRRLSRAMAASASPAANAA